jgi:hypothetical protein
MVMKRSKGRGGNGDRIGEIKGVVFLPFSGWLQLALSPYRVFQSASAFKPPRRPKHSDGLIHDPFSNAEILVDPFLDLFVFGDFVRTEAGAVERSHAAK